MPSFALLGSFGPSSPDPTHRTPVASKYVLDKAPRPKYLSSKEASEGGKGVLGSRTVVGLTCAFAGRALERLRIEATEDRPERLRLDRMVAAIGWSPQHDEEIHGSRVKFDRRSRGELISVRC